MTSFAIIIAIVFSCYVDGFLYPDRIKRDLIHKKGDTLELTCVLQSGLTDAYLYFISLHMDEINVNSDGTHAIVGTGSYTLCRRTSQHGTCVKQSVTHFSQKKYTLNIVSDSFYEIKSDDSVSFPRLGCVILNT